MDGWWKEARKRGEKGVCTRRNQNIWKQRELSECVVIQGEEGSLFFSSYSLPHPLSLHETRYKGEKEEMGGVQSPLKKRTGERKSLNMYIKKKEKTIFSVCSYMCVFRISAQKRKRMWIQPHRSGSSSYTYKNFRSLPAPVRQTLRCFSTPSSLLCGRLLCESWKLRTNIPFFLGYSVVNFYTTPVECVWVRNGLGTRGKEGGVGNIREKADKREKKR